MRDIFGGKRIHLSSDLEDYAKLKRYVIAYGGELEASEGDADLIVDTKSDGSGNTVTGQWVYDCITSGDILGKYY